VGKRRKPGYVIWLKWSGSAKPRQMRKRSESGCSLRIVLWKKFGRNYWNLPGLNLFLSESGIG
jgi:hypothetical protein